MAAYATCKFPLVDRFKNYGEKNIFVGYIDSVLSGFGQIVLSDNPVTGLLIMLGIYLGSPGQFLVTLWAACISSLFAFLIGINRDLVRHGLYTFSGTVVGLGISLWGYSLELILPQVLLYVTIGAILSVVLTAAFSAFLSKWELPFLSIPYWVTLAVLIPGMLIMTNLHSQLLIPPGLGQLSQEGDIALTMKQFVDVTIAGVGEISFQFKIGSGICLLLGLIISSRVDAVVAVICSGLGAGLAVWLGLPLSSILIGLYGYNAALVGISLFGRAFQMSVQSAIFSLLMAVVSVILTASMGIVFLPLGLPVAALPFGLIVLFCMLGRDHLTVLKPISFLKWGVPETIQKSIKEEIK